MGSSKGLKIACAVLTCPCWSWYYHWLHDTMRTLRICSEVYKEAKNTVLKVLFIIMMFLCGCWCIQCILCIISYVHVWKEPCEKFQGTDDFVEMYHNIVLEKDCKLEKPIKESLQKVFK